MFSCLLLLFKCLLSSLSNAALFFSSNNVRVERNILQNPESRYELGSHLIEPNTEIDCRHNWIGDKDEQVPSMPRSA